MHIGVVGYGTVGKSVHNMLNNFEHDVYIDDPNTEFHDFDKINSCTKACFIAVPIPTKKDVQDLSILIRVLEKFKGYKGLIIIKSTILPCNIKMVIELFNYMSVIVSPEFLDQHSPYFFHEKHLMGVTNMEQAKVYRSIFNLDGYGGNDVRTTTPETACMVKFVHNCFGALKVTFFNEMFDVCDRSKINYREMISCMLSMTDHISKTYTTIGADGERGFGGKCFPDNITAFCGQYESSTLESARNKNIIYRSNEMKERTNGTSCSHNTCPCGK